MTILRTEIREASRLSKEFTLEIVALPTVTVTFIDGPRDPVTTITRLVNGYKGNYDPEFDPDYNDVKNALQDLSNTKLKTPLEMGTLVYLLNDVPRSWTHQSVRTRIGASFVQESMRFMGHKGVYRVLVSRDIMNSEIADNYVSGLVSSIWNYECAMGAGIPIEDARAILPTDIMTSMYVGYQMNTFAEVYAQRMCCQAQKGIWQEVMKKMRDLAVEQYGVDFKQLVSAPFERGESCGYRASFDRPCTWQKAKE